MTPSFSQSGGNIFMLKYDSGGETWSWQLQWYVPTCSLFIHVLSLSWIREVCPCSNLMSLSQIEREDISPAPALVCPCPPSPLPHIPSLALTHPPTSDPLIRISNLGTTQIPIQSFYVFQLTKYLIFLIPNWVQIQMVPLFLIFTLEHEFHQLNIPRISLSDPVITGVQSMRPSLIPD